MKLLLPKKKNKQIDKEYNDYEFYTQRDTMYDYVWAYLRSGIEEESFQQFFLEWYLHTTTKLLLLTLLYNF